MPSLELLRKRLQEAHPNLLGGDRHGDVDGRRSRRAVRASYGQRHPERSNRRYGYRERGSDTRLGTIPLVCSNFARPSAEEVWAQDGRAVEQLQDRFADAATLLGDAAEDILAFTAFPSAPWRQIWSNNPLEHLDREIRRRTDVVGIFPNRAAVIRSVGAILAKQHATGWSPAATWPMDGRGKALAVGTDTPRRPRLNRTTPEVDAVFVHTLTDMTRPLWRKRTPRRR